MSQPLNPAQGVPLCTCPCSCDETPHDGSPCPLHSTVTDWEDVENHVEAQRQDAKSTYAEALRLIRKHMQPGDTVGKMFIRVAQELESTTEAGEVCDGCGKLLICRNCGKFRSPAPATTGDGADDLYRYIPDIVKNAMLTMWNYICNDTKCHPLDIEHGKGNFLTFKPAHWAQFSGEMVEHNIRDLFDVPGRQPADKGDLVRALTSIAGLTDNLQAKIAKEALLSASQSPAATVGPNYETTGKGSQEVRDILGGVPELWGRAGPVTLPDAAFDAIARVFTEEIHRLRIQVEEAHRLLRESRRYAEGDPTKLPTHSLLNQISAVLSSTTCKPAGGVE